MIIDKKANKFYRMIDFLHEHVIVVIIAVVALTCAISLIAIITGKVSKGQDENSNLTYEKMDTIYFAMDEVDSLNPLSSTDSDVYYISQLLFSSLFDLDENLNIKKDLVSKYSPNATEGTVSITLRSDVKFSNGSKLDANDIVYTVNQIKGIGKKSPYYSYVSKINYVTVNSSTRLKVVFKNPSDAALDNLTFPIVSDNDYNTGSGYKPVGSGLYKYSSYDETKYLKLKPNKKYYGTVTNNNIEFKIIPSKSKATGLMTTDSITAYVNTATDADSDAEDKDLQCTQINSNEAEYIGFNFNNKYLSKAKVRQAIALAIDTDKIATDNYGGMAISNDSIYFPGFLGTDNKGDAYGFNQSKAAKLLKDCGFKDSNEDSILEDTDGNIIKFTILVNSNNTSRVDAANDIAKNLTSVGVDVTVNKLSKANYTNAYNRGNFDMVMGGFAFDKKYDLRELFDIKNNLNYNNGDVLNLVEKMETSLSETNLKNTYETLKKKLKKDLPYYCLCYKTYSFVSVNKFEAEEIPTFFDRFRGCNTWTWERTLSNDNSTEESQ